MRFLWLLLAASLASCKPSPPASVRELRIAAAADLQFALPEIAARFEREHPGAKVSPALGSSGNLFAQIQNGAPFDLFLSADDRLPAKLAEAGLADPATLFAYGRGILVLWVPKAASLPGSLKELAQPGFRKLAIGNPAHAPYGAAAEAALRHEGVYEEIAGKLVLGENIAQAAQFAQSGAADAGLIALSLALAPKMAEAGHFREVPPEDYPPLRQAGVILRSSRQPALAGEFSAAMLAPAGQEILRRNGFRSP